MEALQKEFAGKLKVVPVSRENITTLLKFFASKNGQRFNHITSVAADPYLHKIFPHVAIPYIVWIKDGKVLNTTDGSQVTAGTVSEILQNQQSSLQTVLQIDRSRPLMLAEQFDLEKETGLLNYALLTKGRMRAIVPGSGFKRHNGVVYGRQWTNISLMNIYRGIAHQVFEQRGDHFSDRRLRMNIKDVDAVDFKTLRPDEPVGHKLYSFEVIVPFKQADSLYTNMLRSLSAFSGYPAKLEKLPAKTWVLKKTVANAKLATGGGEPISALYGSSLLMQNVPLSHLVNMLNDITRFTDLPVIDDTGHSLPVDMDLGKVNTMSALKNALRKYGLDLVLEERELLTLTVSDTK